MRSPPPEVAVNRSLEPLAPQFRAAVEAILAELGDAVVSEGLRTFERQSFLYGFGRDYDDGRGIVTNAPSHLNSWHGYGLAVDLIHTTKGWDAGERWFRLMGDVAKARGCDWGGDWHHPDRPHIQWGKCKDSPSAEAKQLLRQGGVPAVWAAVGAA